MFLTSIGWEGIEAIMIDAIAGTRSTLLTSRRCVVCAQGNDQRFLPSNELLRVYLDAWQLDINTATPISLLEL